jgi:dTDP-4-dehydrorhamnose reductase
MKILILGIEGQLGRDIERTLKDHDLSGPLYDELDITDEDRVEAAVSGAAPDWVINSAAMTNVDKCETEQELARAVNAAGAHNAARAAAAAGASLIHISTDYVFDGAKNGPYVETDDPRPLNVYGETKLAGEQFVARACPDHYIVRTSGLYGTHECWGKGTNFVETMLRLSRDHTRLQIVRDEVLTPTFTEDLAGHILRMIENRPPWGIYHATNDGRCSWFDFATEIFRLESVPIELEGITSAVWGAPARRPANSVLENAALKSADLDEFPGWRDALERYLSERRRKLRES